jgi:hypothetical protein
MGTNQETRLTSLVEEEAVHVPDHCKPGSRVGSPANSLKVHFTMPLTREPLAASLRGVSDNCTKLLVDWGQV